MVSLYDQIEALGKERGYKNMTELCKAASVPRAVMSELRAKRTNVLSMKNLMKFSSLLKVSVDSISGSETSSILELTAQDNNLTNALALLQDDRERAASKAANDQKIGLDDFTYAMHEESANLTEGDKALLLAMAQKLNAKNKNGKTD